MLAYTEETLIFMSDMRRGMKKKGRKENNFFTICLKYYRHVCADVCPVLGRITIVFHELVLFQVFENRDYSNNLTLRMTV